jgi:DnaJ-domain-containing protein 1
VPASDRRSSEQPGQEELTERECGETQSAERLRAEWYRSQQQGADLQFGGESPAPESASDEHIVARRWAEECSAALQRAAEQRAEAQRRAEEQLAEEQRRAEEKRAAEQLAARQWADACQAAREQAERRRQEMHERAAREWEEAERREQEERQQHPQRNGERRAAASVKSDCEILEVSPRASVEQIDAAYRRLIQLYHPDKVESLAPEFKAIAVARMKEINAAYERLTSRRTP